MDNNFKVNLEAMIDDSSLSKIQKKLAKERFKISTDIELTSFSKNKADIEKQFKDLLDIINTLTKGMSFLNSLGLNIDLFPGIKDVGRQNGALTLSNV